MATRFASPVVRRAQVPLTGDDLTALEQLCMDDISRGFLAAHQMIPATGEVSEAAFLHAVLQAGIKAVQDSRDELGYALLAKDSEHIKHDYNVRAHRGLRRRPRHADDA